MPKRYQCYATGNTANVSLLLDGDDWFYKVDVYHHSDSGDSDLLMLGYFVSHEKAMASMLPYGDVWVLEELTF